MHLAVSARPHREDLLDRLVRPDVVARVRRLVERVMKQDGCVRDFGGDAGQLPQHAFVGVVAVEEEQRAWLAATGAPEP